MRRCYPTSPARLRAAPSMFVLLDQASKRESILKLADAGTPDHAISSMTGLDVGVVRRWIAERSVARAQEALS